MALYKYTAAHQGTIIATDVQEVPCLWYAHMGKRDFLQKIIDNFRNKGEYYEPDDFDIYVRLMESDAGEYYE